MDKEALSERDICTKYSAPAIAKGGRDMQRQVREEVTFTGGRVIERGKMHTRGQKKRADYLLFCEANLPLAIVEAKANSYPVGGGMQQALDYAEVLDIPFVYASNGDGLIEHDRTGQSEQVERELTLDEFPPPAELWQWYRRWKGLSDEADRVVLQDYYAEAGGTDQSQTYGLSTRSVRSVFKEPDLFSHTSLTFPPS